MTHDTSNTLDMGCCPACGRGMVLRRSIVTLPQFGALYWASCPEHGPLADLMSWLDFLGNV